jgi:type III restriction enzyme
MVTREDKCHLNFMVADTDSWEQRTALALEDMPEVKSYVKNHNLGFTIPYTIDGDQRDYTPDFIAKIDDGHGPDDLLNLIVEVSGPDKRDKAAKVATADTLWVPAINNHGAFGRWAFIEIRDPSNTATEIKAMLAKQPVSQSNAAY